MKIPTPTEFQEAYKKNHRQELLNDFATKILTIFFGWGHFTLGDIQEVISQINEHAEWVVDSRWAWAWTPTVRFIYDTSLRALSLEAKIGHSWVKADPATSSAEDLEGLLARSLAEFKKLGWKEDDQ